MNLKNACRDERGVSEVIGFLFIVIIVMLMSISYQASFVPQLNEEAEWQANNQLEKQSLDLNSVVTNVVSDGSPRTQTLGVDIEYPQQVGTPIPSWAMTSESGSVVVSGTVGSDMSRETHIVTMRGKYVSADYGAFRYDNGVSVRQNPDGPDFVKNSQSVIRGDRIVLTRVESAPEREASNAPLLVSVTAINVAETQEVSPDGATMSVQIPTDLSETAWRDLVSEELAVNGGNIESVNYTENAGSPNQVEFVLDGDVTYTLVTGGVEIDAK